ncbi:protein FAR-RED ELONGATED HYPOCOTYL 3-like isoform X2 [Andrographis paniculata]|uniref:protein FAR-RED ELONGATED HYPOCOTYL 3-like isoform X2 n=1 Tax=Andrographis paniculata TaxID=175694 RepID=UPI0021E9A538|nr:protein FAR-RED ELONGATED HYPOCOTYL 3-like isoform X2 [Andrographis paniculata]
MPPKLLLNSTTAVAAAVASPAAAAVASQFVRPIAEMDGSGFDLEQKEVVCGDSDDEGAVRLRSGGEVVDVNEGQDEAHILELEKKLLEHVVYSEEEAYMLYCDYAHAMGFNVRRGKQYYFTGSRRIRSKTYCCSKEGVKDDKTDITSVGYKKPETRTGCRAMISFVCDDNGQWKVTRFFKEHNHDMALPYAKPSVKSGQAILAANSFCNGNALESVNEHDKIRELSLQLAIAKTRAETFERQAAIYKRQLHTIVQHIEEHNHSLSNKIQKVLHSVKELESKDQ